LLNTPRPIAF
jgi:DNA replication licensing factor MCM3